MNLVSNHRAVYFMAGNPATPLEQLCLLSACGDSSIRARVAENPSLPSSCLAELAGDVAPSVRIAVTENASTPLLILELLAEDDHLDVRFAIAENAGMPPHILRILAQDENPYIVDRALKTLDRLTDTQAYCDTARRRRRSSAMRTTAPLPVYHATAV